MRYKTLPSKEDVSVNFVFENGLEARYVRREEDKILIYLSSHYGCNKACRFCHLTQTGQTDLTSATYEEFMEQAKVVLEHYVHQPKAKYVNFNFMARGEFFANDTVHNQGVQLISGLRRLAHQYGLKPKFNISTIIPEELRGKDIVDLLGQGRDIHIFYSAYSVDPAFRKRWLPKALSVENAAMVLRRFQQNQHSEPFITIHHALIKDENDSLEDLFQLSRTLYCFYPDLKANFNLVRYNPYSEGQGEETTEERMQAYLEKAGELFTASPARIIPRVGSDIKASCGTFVPASLVKND